MPSKVDDRGVNGAPLLVTLDDAAWLLSCSRRFVERMVERGDLPVSKLGRLTRVTLDDLRALVTVERVGPSRVLASNSSDAVGVAVTQRVGARRKRPS